MKITAEDEGYCETLDVKGFALAYIDQDGKPHMLARGEIPTPDLTLLQAGLLQMVGRRRAKEKR